MKKILIFKNIEHEHLGLLEDVINESDYLFEVINLHDETILPLISEYDAFIILGGPESANDLTKKMFKEIFFVQEVLHRKMPFLGICLGMQILAKAAGGNVIKAPIKEIGFCDAAGDPYVVHLTAEGRKDDLFKGLSNEFSVFQLHGETIELNDRIGLLGMGDHCVNQVVKVGDNAYGIQSHFELTKPMLQEWLKKDSDLKEMNHKMLLSDFKQLEKEYNEVGKTLFSNFLKNIS